ncbi:MAG: hypothetical protein JOZ72_01600 [Alphaproteobacteria bacterium]|nr:hypothetical protein [Alphaproteobacteria bacterium]
MFRRVSTVVAFSLFALAAQAAPAFTVLHNFNRADGDEPGWLARKSNGALYGVTLLGGDGQSTGLGVLYKIAPDGTYSIVHAFTDTPDGALPIRLFSAPGDVIYGTTGSGGTQSVGTVFRLDEHDHYTVLHSFDLSSEGLGPSWLTRAADGSFYGVASDLGRPEACPLHHADGTLFRMTENGEITVLHTFCENIDGSHPNSVVIAADGKLYGTCAQDGPLHGSGSDSDGGGTFWRASLKGKVKRLFTFGPKTLNGNEAVGPNGVVQAPNGLFYGTSNGGGSASNGAIFRATARGKVKTIHSFSASEGDGGDPESNFVLAGDGNFYGTASKGGLPVNDPHRSGVIYRADVKGLVQVLHTYTIQDGMTPQAPPLRDDATGRIYATAIRGGASQDGTVGVLDGAMPR